MDLNELKDLLAGTGLELEARHDGLALTDGVMTMRGDFARMKQRLRPANLPRELLVKAAKIKRAGKDQPAENSSAGQPGESRLTAVDNNPAGQPRESRLTAVDNNPAGQPRESRLTAVDATAGLGEDAILLAAAGFDVTLFERNPVIAALLRDAMRRAGDDPALAEIIGHMHFVEGDSVAALPSLGFKPDVVLLDPMFPAKGKDAAAKKKLQMLQQLERPCDDEGALLDAAFAAHPRKVVVKRPVKGPHLANRKPSYAISGKAIRYDVYA